MAGNRQAVVVIVDTFRIIAHRGASAYAPENAMAGHDIAVLSGFNQSRELVEAAHACGLEARSSGIKNRQRMAEAVEIGCNGMTINWPDWLIDYVARRK